MARALFLVIESRDRWWYDFEGIASGPFDSVQQAALAAQQAARAEATKSRRPCEVMAPGGDGRFWRIWSSEQDRTASPRPEPEAAPQPEPPTASEALPEVEPLSDAIEEPHLLVEPEVDAEPAKAVVPADEPEQGDEVSEAALEQTPTEQSAAE